MKFDLIVIGAGILGSAHAYHAAQKGLKVLVLEKDNFQVGSTVRNFGQAVPSGMTGKWFQYGIRSLDIYQNIQSTFDISVRRNGSIYLASDEEEWGLLQELYQYHQSTGYPCHLLSKRQCTERYPALKENYVKGGLSFPNECSIEPNLMIHRLSDYLIEQKNVQIRYNSTVVACEALHEETRVQTAAGEKFYADKVIICSGYQFNLLFPEIFKNSGLIVSKLQMLQTVRMPTVSLSGNILTGLTIRRYESFETLPSFAKLSQPEHYRHLQEWGIHLLFKQAIDGSIIIGDSHEYAPVGETDKLGFDTKEWIDEYILKEAERIVQFPVRKIARKWAGFYTQHPQEIFEYQVSKNIHIFTGIGGKGMTSGFGYAEANINRLF